AEDGIRDATVTGVQTCALPICLGVVLGLYLRIRLGKFLGVLNLPIGERGCQLVDLGGQDKVVLRQAIDFMRPGCDLDFSPGQLDIGVMTLLFRQLANQIDEPKSLTEIRKLEQLRNVVLVDGAPTVHPLLERCEFLALQRWHASAAGDAEFAGQVRHNLRHCSTEARDWRCKADRKRRPPVGAPWRIALWRESSA